MLFEKVHYETIVAALEDKIVQQAVVTILNQIYEMDFKGFSYGFRPGRNPHQALDAARLWRAVLNRRSQRAEVNWQRLTPLLERWIPFPRVLHPYPQTRFAATHPK